MGSGGASVSASSDARDSGDEALPALSPSSSSFSFSAVSGGEPVFSQIFLLLLFQAATAAAAAAAARRRRRRHRRKRRWGAHRRAHGRRGGARLAPAIAAIGSAKQWRQGRGDGGCGSMAIAV